MSLKVTSQELLAHALKELLQTNDLDSVSVESILAVSGVSRATFYKYFGSKYELAEHVFLSELANGQFFDYSRSLEEREIEILKYLERNRTLYRNALTSREFRDAWMRAAYKADREYLGTLYASTGASQEEIRLFAEFASRAMVDTTWLWVTDPGPYSPEYLARKLVLFVEHGTSALTALGKPGF